jgi:hypothetical protein
MKLIKTNKSSNSKTNKFINYNNKSKQYNKNIIINHQNLNSIKKLSKNNKNKNNLNKNNIKLNIKINNILEKRKKQKNCKNNYKTIKKYSLNTKCHYSNKLYNYKHSKHNYYKKIIKS